MMNDLIKKEMSAGKGFATTVLYLPSLSNNEYVTQDIAEAAGVTEVAIQDRVKD